MKELCKYIAIAIVVLLCFGRADGQFMNNDKTKMSDRKLMRLAKQDIALGQLRDASYYYAVFLQRHPGEIDIAWRLAEIYRKLNAYDKAGYLYYRVDTANWSKNIVVRFWFDFIGQDKQTSYYQKYPLAKYHEAMMLKKTGQYTKSRYKFEQFITGYHLKDSMYYRAIAFNEIAGIDFALSLQGKISRVKKTKFIPFNQAYEDFIDFAPQYVDDSLIIYEHATTLVLDRVRLPTTVIRYAKPYKGIWKDAGPVTGYKDINDNYIGINDQHYLTMGGCFSPDHKKYYFTRCTIEKNPFAPGGSAYALSFENLGIYYCSYSKNNGWGAPKRLDENINMPGTVNIMPAIGYDERHREVLWFSSNRPGGKGGFDIWQTTFASGRNEFDDPVDLDSRVNTNQNEITPYYDQDSSILYFSSNGWPTIGGFDIFKSKKIIGGYDTARNIGLPFNTFDDDEYFSVNKSHQNAMSTKGVNCGSMCVTDYMRLPFFDCQEIYHYKLDVPQYGVAGRVVAGTGKDTSYLAGATIKVYAAMNTADNKEILFTSVQSKGRNFVFPLHPKKEYMIQVSKEGYYPADTAITTDTFTHSDTLFYLFHLTPIPKDTPIVIKNIVFNYNDSTLTPECKKVIDSTLLRYMRRHVNEKIMILSHSDSIGTDEYNLHLSQARAQSIVDYMVGQGISPKRMIPKGYGSRHPVAPNKNKDGSDNPTGRTANRRTEFRVIGKIN